MKIFLCAKLFVSPSPIIVRSVRTSYVTKGREVLGKMNLIKKWTKKTDYPFLCGSKKCELALVGA